MPTMPTPCWSAGDVTHGFAVRSVSPLPELFLVAYELEHLASGARMVHLHADDSENLFSVNFPTPPEDDTGLPHILEHAVLAGSRRYPVRDPFFEMFKMSMATFINAMTGKDCTYYPVCSNVRADFFNLADVYFDAVFHPLLTEETFLREGHHLCPADPARPSGALGVNGIVYNEMKAAYAQPESRLWRDMCRNLLPDTCYGHDSGGDPEAIPTLTYERFLAFHRRYYHPSNARLLCYGDIEPDAFLQFLQPKLDAFVRQPLAVTFPPTPRWSAPRELTTAYDAGEDVSAARTYLQMSWKVPGGLDAEALVLLNVLALVLLGDDAAPLKRALIDSDLGRDLTESGLLLMGSEGVFGVGLQGSEPDRLAPFRELVLETLRRLCDEGIAPELVESAFRRHRYEVLEIAVQRPLRLARDVLTPWILGGDPLLYLRMGGLLETCLRRWREDPALLSTMIREHLLDNPHRLDQRLVPDPAWQRRNDAAFAERMAAMRLSLTDEQATALARRAEDLQRKAGVPNSAEALATLPQLARTDLPPEPARIPTHAGSLREGAAFLRNDVFSNGVNYLALHLDLDGLDPDLWPFVPFYVEVFNKMGAAGRDYAAMARRASAATGGLSCGARFGTHATDPHRTCKGLVLAVKALDEQMDAALEVLSDKLRAPDPRDRARLRDVATQLLTGLQTQLVASGNRTALTHLQAGMTEAGYLAELAGGRSLYRAARKLVGQFDAQADAVIDAVLRIDAQVRNPRRLTASFTGSDPAADAARSALTSLLDSFPDRPLSPRPTGFRPFAGAPRTGLAGPLQVAHCAQAMPAPHASHPDAPLLTLGMGLLRVDYMISELRFKGNAYGASCSYGGGVLALSTYADPHIRRTLDVFAALPAYVRKVAWTETEVTRGVLSTAKEFVRPIRPEAATATALARAVAGLDDARVAEQYEAIRRATPERIKEALLAVLEPGLPNAPVAVVSSREKLEAANRELGDRALTLEPLLEEEEPASSPGA